MDVSVLAPQVSWGTSPEQTVPVTGSPPDPAASETPGNSRQDREEPRPTWAWSPGVPVRDIRIDRVFIGSCTNGRLDDLRAAAEVVRGRRVADSVAAIVVPGSMSVRAAAEAEGLDKVFLDAGFEWRESGCSMCVGDERRPPDRRRALRIDLQPQLRGPPGQGRTHPPDVAANGRRRRPGRADRRCQRVSASMTDRIAAIPALLAEDNIDTDVIFPARFLLLLDRQGLGRYAFYERAGRGERFRSRPRALRRAPASLSRAATSAPGSSREQAVWALEDLGIRCVIAPSFGEIFFSPTAFATACCRSSLLPDDIARVDGRGPRRATVTVDLSCAVGSPAVRPRDEIRDLAAPQVGPAGRARRNRRDPQRRHDAVADHEAKAARDTPWVQIPGERMAALRRAISGDTGQ